MRNFDARVLALLCLATVAGCSTNTGIAKVTTTPGTLEMSVGTINDPNATITSGGETLNIVTSFRNSLGNSAYENPGQFSVTGPDGTVIAAVAPSAQTAACDQLYSYGQFPGCGPFAGQPPAYSPADAVAPGYATGIIVSDAAAASGNYTVNTTVAVNGGNQPFSGSASLPATPTVLGADAGVTNFDSDGMGGGTFTIAQPAGVTESLVVVISGGSQVASAETNNTTATITGAGSACPGGPGVPIPCGAFTAVVVGADYPMVEAGPPASHAVKPTLTGANGTSDVTVSGVANLDE